MLVEEGMVRAVNVLAVEDYLISVIASEMSATAVTEYLKAHAVISRSWLLSQIIKGNPLVCKPRQQPYLRLKGKPIRNGSNGGTGKTTPCLTYVPMIIANVTKALRALHNRWKKLREPLWKRPEKYWYLKMLFVTLVFKVLRWVYGTILCLLGRYGLSVFAREIRRSFVS